MSKRPHLEDLFNKGETITITDSEGTEYEIFVRRPTSNQQQVALDAANAKMASYTIQYENKEGPRYDSVAAMVRAEDDKDALIDQIIQYASGDARQEAYHETLYGEHGGVWDGKDGGRSYLDTLSAIQERIAEIERYNSEIEEDDHINREDDEILLGLLKTEEEFQAEVKVREDELMDVERQKHANKPVAQLQNELIKFGIETEGKLYWYEEYQTKLLYYACRDPEETSELYFSNPWEIMELPTYIRTTLYKAYEALELGSEEVKNSLSLPSS